MIRAFIDIAFGKSGELALAVCNVRGTEKGRGSFILIDYTFTTKRKFLVDLVRRSLASIPDDGDPVVMFLPNEEFLQELGARATSTATGSSDGHWEWDIDGMPDDLEEAIAGRSIQWRTAKDAEGDDDDAWEMRCAVGSARSELRWR